MLFQEHKTRQSGSFVTQQTFANERKTIIPATRRAVTSWEAIGSPSVAYLGLQRCLSGPAPLLIHVGAVLSSQTFTSREYCS